MNSRTSLALALAGVLVMPAALAQICNAHIRRGAPDDRYVVNAVKDTVLDKQTGLIWKRCVEGQSGADCGAGSPTLLRWGDALSQAAASTFAGYKDWRIPNSKELLSLLEIACSYPALNATVFPEVPPENSVWASSPYADDADYAWFVSFGVGGYGLGNRNGSYLAVRLVRGGQ